MSERRSCISGLGMFVPPRVVTNHDLTEYMETSHEWIVERTGIEQRHWVDGESNADLAEQACRQAVADAGLALSDIDMLIYATLSPDHDFPGTGVFAQRQLGLDPLPVLDIRQQCTGFPDASMEEREAVVKDAVKEQVSALSDYKRPRRLHIRNEEFQKTSTQKPKRYLYNMDMEDLDA